MDPLEHVGWDWHCPICNTYFNDIRLTRPAAKRHMDSCQKRSAEDREVFRKTHRWPKKQGR